MFKLFKKDFKLFFKDKRSVLLTFFLPIILISLFAFAFGGIGGNDDEIRKVELLLSDLDNTKTSKSIIAKLDSVEGLKIIKTEIDKAKKAIIKGNYIGVLVFHQGFEKASISGKNVPIELFYDKAKEAEIGMLQPLLLNTLMSSIGKQKVTGNIDNYLTKTFPGLDSATRNKILNSSSEEDASGSSFSFDSDLKMTSLVGNKKENSSNLGLIQAVAGTAIMMLLFSIAGLGTSIFEEKENGTIKRLLISPLDGSSILYGKMLFAFCIAIIQLTLMFLFSWIAFGLDLSLNIPALLLMIVVTAFAVSSFGIFLAAVSKTRQQAQSLGTLIILIMSAIGGSMIPLFIMPVIMKRIAVVSVNYWGIQGFYDIFWRNLPLMDILPRILVLLGIGIFMTLLSIRLFKKNILKLI